MSVAANARDRARKRKDFITAVKWSKYFNRERIVLPPTYYPAFSILQVQYTHETEVVDVIGGHTAPASMTVVDWFNFDPSLSLLTGSQESATLPEARATATRLIETAVVGLRPETSYSAAAHLDIVVACAQCEFSLKEIIDMHVEALAELAMEKTLQACHAIP